MMTAYPFCGSASLTAAAIFTAPSIVKAGPRGRDCFHSAEPE